MLRGLNPWWHWLLERENPRRCRYAPDNITGANLEPRPLRIAAKRCHYNTGGYMTLAELAWPSGMI